jgi:hypothetical protein
LKNAKPEKLILKIPKWFWKLLRLPSVAFCLPRTRAVLLTLALIGVGFFEVIFAHYVYLPFSAKLISTVLWFLLFSFAILSVLPTIFIRKDCFECQFGFHIIAHERNHLKLGKSEQIVEEETLNHTGERLIPILLSSPRLCKDCRFLYRKMYCQATLNYIKESRK